MHKTRVVSNWKIGTQSSTCTILRCKFQGYIPVQWTVTSQIVPTTTGPH